MRRGNWSVPGRGLVLGLAVVLPAPAALANGVSPWSPRAWSSPTLPAGRAPFGPGALLTVAVGSGPQGAAENDRTKTLYVPNSGDGTVSVVNLITCSSLDLSGCAQTAPVVRVGTLPLGAAVDEATNTIYITNAADDTVSVINGATCNASEHSGCDQRPVTVPVGTFDNAVVVDPLTNMVFVTDQDASPGSVSVIDGNACTGAHPSGCTHQPMTSVRVGGGASGVGVNPATDTIYVTNTGQDSNNQPVPDGNTVSVINGASCRPAHPGGCAAVGTVPVGVSPVAIAADTATNTVYVANTYDGAVHEGTVSVVNGAHCDGSDPSRCGSETPPQVTVGADPIGLVADGRNRAIFVANGLDDTVSVINAAVCNATGTLGCGDRPPTMAVGGGPTWPVLDLARRTLYVVNQVNNDVAVLSDASCDAQTSIGCRRLARTTPAGSFPNAAGIDEHYHTVYIGDANAFRPPYAVSMIDTAACGAAQRSGCGGVPRSTSVPGSPATIDVNQQTDTAYVASNEALQVIGASSCNADTTAGCGRIARVPAGGYAIAVDASTDTIYSANSGPDHSGYVSVIDGRHCNAADLSGCADQTTANTPTVRIGHSPGNMAIDTSTHTLYAVNIGDHTVSVIDTRHCHAGDSTGCAGQPAATVAVAGVSGPVAIGVDAGTHTAYVTDSAFEFSPGDMSMIDTRHCRAGDVTQCANQTLVMIPTPTGPGSMIRIDARTDAVYLANLSDSSVTVFDGRRCNAMRSTSCAPIRTVAVGSSPSDLALDPQRGTAYAANFYDADASVFAMVEPPGR